MDISKSSSSYTIHGEDNELWTENKQNSLRASYHTLQLESKSKDESLILFQQQKDETLQQNSHLIKALEEALSQRNNLNKELKRVEDSSRDRQDELVMRDKEEIMSELDASKQRIEGMLRENMENIRVLSEATRSVRECLARVIESLDDIEIEKHGDKREEFEYSVESKQASKIPNDVELKMNLCKETIKPVREESELSSFLMELKALSKTASEVELKMNLYKEMREREKRKLENSLVSLTEENHDINNLLRIALVEKDAVEKSLNMLKMNCEHKGVAFFKIAERGLQKVGFGFMTGTGANETSSGNSSPKMSTKSQYGSECDEKEAVSLASTLEAITKNLRLEVAQLRRSLEESRSDSERLQSIAEKQAQKLSENTLYIKELENQQTLLMQNVEDLFAGIKEAGEEVARWREACELEVEASKHFVKEHDRLVAIFMQELEKTKAALNISNGRSQLKEELADAAMAAQATAERSLRLADSRAAELREQIEELTRQLEAAEKREKGQRYRVRHICWPWRVLKFSPPANDPTTTVQNVKRMLPEMQALLH